MSFQVSLLLCHNKTGAEEVQRDYSTDSDVISTRRLSYILYLPDPAEEWDPAWGGALELYPVEGKHIPSNIPSVTIPPSKSIQLPSIVLPC